MKKTAFITGATSGIGLSVSKKFADNGIDLIICGRREDVLIELKEELGRKVEVEILKFDVGNRDEVKQKINSLSDKWKQKIDILINNAGNAHGLDSFEKGSLDDFDKMIDYNVKGLLYVSKEIIPFMIERNLGHIVNVSSIAGKETYPMAAVYCASKHSVEAISKGMRIDLVRYGIKVTNIAPGAVETGFSIVRFKGDEQRAKNVYKGYKPLIADDIADAIYYAVSTPDHVQIADMTIFPKAQASGTVFNREE